MEEQKNRAPAAAATIRIVEYMAQSSGGVGLSEISGGTGINKNMISRILSVLTETKWVIFHEKTGKYSLSLRLFCLGSSVLGRRTLMQYAEPYMERLNDLTGECIQMAVLHEGKAVYIAQLEAKGVAGIHGRLGAGYPLDTTAPGKVLKAFVAKAPDMEDTRRRGYSIDNEEYGRGVICIAAPVYDYTGEAIAAVGISSLTVNHSIEELVERYADTLVEQTKSLSAELGYDEQKQQ